MSNSHSRGSLAVSRLQSLFGAIERFGLDRSGGRSRSFYALAVMALCIGMGIVGFRITAQTNHNTDEYDQGAYLLMAQEMKDSLYPWYSDSTRNPLFPWLSARFFNPDDPSFFASGKNLNVLLGVLGTSLLGMFFFSRMGPLAAFNATAIAGLGVLLPLSTFFGAEVMFLILFLFLCVVAMRLLHENPPWLYAVLGLLSGLTWLAKPSATPFLGLFVLFSFARLALGTFANRLPWHLQAPDWSAKNLFLGLALFGAIYFALISPRLIHAQRTWGNAFYSLPSFWFWADDWKTCVEKYTDCRKVTLAKLPPEEQPSLSGYFRRHTVSDAIQRVTNGAAVRLRQFFHPEGKWRFPYDKHDKPRRVILPHRGFYLLGLAALATAMAVFAIKLGRLHDIGSVTIPLLLGLAMFVLYTLAMGWYLPIGPGHRFITTLFLPILWLLSQGSDQLRIAAHSRPANILFFATHLLIAFLLLSRFAILLSTGSFNSISAAF